MQKNEKILAISRDKTIINWLLKGWRMAGSFTEGAHWRDTARPVKLWIVNSNATFPIVFALFHIRWWTMSLALAAVVALSVLEYYGFTIVVFGRYLRNLLAGSRRLAIPWWM